MITKPTMYGIACDNCGEDYETGNGFTAYNDGGFMRDDAQLDGWLNLGNKDYCPKCHEFNDEDELIIKQQPNK